MRGQRGGDRGRDRALEPSDPARHRGRRHDLALTPRATMDEARHHEPHHGRPGTGLERFALGPHQVAVVGVHPIFTYPIGAPDGENTWSTGFHQ